MKASLSVDDRKVPQPAKCRPVPRAANARSRRSQARFLHRHQAASALIAPPGEPHYSGEVKQLNSVALGCTSLSLMRSEAVVLVSASQDFCRTSQSQIGYEPLGMG